MDVMIRHKGIEHGILTDAPFIGARICAISCSNNCPGCFNQHMLDMEYKTQRIQDIIAEIQSNKLNKGIILGGLEWTEQLKEMNILIVCAIVCGLKVMIYTHMDIWSFIETFPALKGTEDVFVKCGEYVQEDKHYYDEKYDVTLASSNQRIYTLSELK